MPGGRPPKPIEVKRRTGNPGKRKLPATRSLAALEPMNGVPPVPMTLEVVGRAAWTSVWSGGKTWLSPKIDLIRIETVCRILDEIANMREYVAKLGTILEEPITTPTGVLVGSRFVANPAVKMLRDAEKQLDRELSALGFDPSSRSKLGLAEIKKQSILETLGLGLKRPTGNNSEDAEVIDAEVIDAEVIDIAPDA